MTTEVPAETVEAANAKSRRLRELLQAPEIVIMPGAFNVLSALLFQHLGFQAVQGSSAGIANAMGYPDLGIGRDRTVAVTKEMVAAVSVPVNADGEDGFGGPEEVQETVRQFVAAGAAGMNMEDGVEGGLASLDAQLEKIAAFMEARQAMGSEFLLNARVDAFVKMREERGEALKEAIRRGQAYAEAGADSVFFFGPHQPDEIGTLAKEVPAPVSVLAAPGVPGAAELERLGVARVSYGSMFLRVAVGAVERAAREVLELKTHELMGDAIGGAEMRAILESRRG